MSTVRRLAGTLAAVTALGYCVEGAVAVRAPQPEHGWHTSGYVVEVAFAIALAASLPLVPLVRRGASRAANGASYLVGAGFAAMLVSALASTARGGDALGLLFLVGVLASIAGLLVLASAALRSGEDGRFMAPLLALGLVASMALGDHGGGIVFGAAWAAIIPAVRGAEPVPAITLAG
jgi:hypothetical protein